MLDMFAIAFVALFAAIVVIGHVFLFTAVVFGIDGVPRRRTAKNGRAARRIPATASR